MNRGLRRVDNKSPRGLTLLEVLVATAILAMLAGAVVPSIAQALARLRPVAKASIVDIADLGVVADQFIAEPEAFEKGLAASQLHEIEFKQIGWPTDEPRFEKFTAQPIRIQAIRRAGGDESETHLWLSFSCDGVSVMRWVSIPPPPPPQRERLEASDR